MPSPADIERDRERRAAAEEDERGRQVAEREEARRLAEAAGEATMNTAEVTRRVRAELERGDIPTEILSNNTIEARGHFITTVILAEQSVRGGEHGRVQVFIDGQPRCGFGFEAE